MMYKDLFIFFRKKLLQHISLLVIIIGAISFFLSNILTKEIFSPIEYGQYSIFVTYFSLIYLLGILGFEQTFLRFSQKTTAEFIETQKIQIYILSTVSLISSLISSVFFKIYYPEIQVNSYILFFASFGMISLLALFNVLRLNGNFVLSQSVSNFWKFGLLVISVSFYIFENFGFEYFINTLGINIIIIFLCSIYVVLKTVKLKFNEIVTNRELFLSGFYFFLAILSFSLLTFSDRILVENKFSVELFGDYFYLTNFFLAPYAILQNYVGFKQLIFFKNNFSLEYFNKINLKSLYLGIILAVVLYLFSLVVDSLQIVNFDFNQYSSIVPLLLLMGIVRLYSTSILSAFEAKTTVKALRKSNLIIVGNTFAVLLFAFFISNSLESILICIVAVWILRAVVHKRILVEQLVKQ